MKKHNGEVVFKGYNRKMWENNDNVKIRIVSEKMDVYLR